MIQRIQSLYLLLSVILGVVCLCLPIGVLSASSTNGEVVLPTVLYNLYAVSGGEHNYQAWPLLAILVMAIVIALLAIFLFKKRALQMRMVNFSLVLCVLWYAYLAFVVLTGSGEASFRPTVWTSLPLVMAILDYLAFRGILKDELLIRSLDRLR